MLSKLKAFVSNWSTGLIGLPIAALLWLLSPYILRAYDVTAGVFDAGVLQIPIFAAICLFFGSFLTWIIIKLDFPTIDKWADQGFAKDWNSIQPHQRICYFVILLSAVLLSFVLLCRVV